MLPFLGVCRGRLLAFQRPSLVGPVHRRNRWASGGLRRRWPVAAGVACSPLSCRCRHWPVAQRRIAFFLHCSCRWPVAQRRGAFFDLVGLPLPLASGAAPVRSPLSSRRRWPRWRSGAARSPFRAATAGQGAPLARGAAARRVVPPLQLPFARGAAVRRVLPRCWVPPLARGSAAWRVLPPLQLPLARRAAARRVLLRCGVAAAAGQWRSASALSLPSRADAAVQDGAAARRTHLSSRPRWPGRPTGPWRNGAARSPSIAAAARPWRSGAARSSSLWGAAAGPWCSGVARSPSVAAAARPWRSGVARSSSLWVCRCRWPLTAQLQRALPSCRRQPQGLAAGRHHPPSPCGGRRRRPRGSSVASARSPRWGSGPWPTRRCSGVMRLSISDGISIPALFDPVARHQGSHLGTRILRRHRPCAVPRISSQKAS